MPCSTRILISSAGECPSACAFLVAISAEMATSPANGFFWPGSLGNESTSVGLSCQRKRRFRDFISALVVIRPLSAPVNPAAWRARPTKRSSASSVRSATRFWKMTNCLPLVSSWTRIRARIFRLIGHVRLVGRRQRRRLRSRWRHWLRFEQRQLLFRQSHLVLVVGANNPLHQMMANYVALVEVHECQAVYRLQDVDRFDQSAAARRGQVDLRHVAGDHRLGIKSESGDKHLHLL